MQALIDFITAAAPWLAIGFAVAVLLAKSVKKDGDKQKYSDYGPEGMCLGMGVGAALGHGGTGLCLGMLIGLLIGTFVKKK